jgi:hypothetical protein
VQLLVLRQGLAVLLLVGGQLGFDFFQLHFQLVRLLGQEFGGLGGPLGTRLDVFVEKQGDQFIGHPLGDFRLSMFESQLEGNGSLVPAPF